MQASTSEFIGTVAPSDFVPSQFGGAMLLDRDVISGKCFDGANGDQQDWSSGWARDTSPDWVRDDDPQSGTSSGVIYDFDGPGLIIQWNDPANEIRRYRINFKAWAVYDSTRCSEKKEWYTRQSYKKTGSWDTGTASSGGVYTLTDNTKAWGPTGWVPGIIKITGGTGAGQVRRVTGNSDVTITVATAWGTQPAGDSDYTVFKTSTWTQVNDVANDNQSADGTTNTTWNLE